MSEIPRWKQKLGCHNGATHWYRGYHHHDILSEHLAYRFWMLIEWWKRLPDSLRWRMADRLSLWALKLRKSEIHDLGYGCIGDKAAALQDDLRMGHVGYIDPNDDEWRNSMLTKIDALGQLAKATWVCSPPNQNGMGKDTSEAP